MAVRDQAVTDRYAVYNADCHEVMADLPDESIHLSIYSPPFGGLYFYSSDERDLSNCYDYDQFFEHYEFTVRDLARLTMRGRVTAVHAMDVPVGTDRLRDFPGDIIRLHERLGFNYIARHAVWKEPLGVRNRTMARGLAHRQIVEDSTLCDVASADYLLLFRKQGQNPIPVAHPRGLDRYAGERQMPAELLKWKDHPGKQTENRYSHWIWRQYASAFWDDVRIGRVLPFKSAKDGEDERHIHPLQLDVIERIVVLRSNPDETILSPFMGVGSEVYGAVINGRKGIGIELKPSYYSQAARNMEAAEKGWRDSEAQDTLFAEVT
jgi:DNA modification methylase